MAMSTSAAEIQREADRQPNGEFGEHVRSGPEIALGAGRAHIVESPVSDRDRNYWVQLEPGKEAHFDISLDGIGFPGRPYTDDTLQLKLDGDQVRSTFKVYDDNISDELDAVFTDLDEANAEELRKKLADEVSRHTGGLGSIVFADSGVEFQHTTLHPLGGDGGVYTSNVMAALEAENSYIYLRDGYYLPTVLATLAGYGYDA